MARDRRKRDMPPGPAHGKKFRPNFRRQMLYAGVAIASIFAGYFLVRQFMPKPKAPDVQVSSPQPWYQNQSPPPSLITTPDDPLFPESARHQATESTAAKRAYEEALPGEIYQPLPGPAPQAPEINATPAPENNVDVSSLPPWRRYAVNVPALGNEPLIAIVIDDMGVDRVHSAQVMNLRAPLTLSFLTYAGDLARQTGLARANGHELMLHVSMEPTSGAVDPGPNVLLTGSDDDEIRRRLDWGFSRFSGYVGINNHMGSKFTADGKGMQVVIDALKHRGLLFLDSRTSAGTVGAKLAKRMGVPMAERNIFIDNVNKLDDVNARLTEVEKFARRNGFAVAIGHPREATIEALKIWLDSVQSRGFRLVPISTIVKKFGVS